jgi:phage tail-like protein
MRPGTARFALLLDVGDWGRCRSADGTRSLAEGWRKPLAERAGLPAWDGGRGVLSLAAAADLLPPTAGESRLAPEMRRGAASDANGNVYWVGDDRRQLMVRSAGTGRSSPFWPDPRAAPRPAGLFAPAEPLPAPTRTYRALAVLAEGWLAATYRDAGGDCGLSLFDLVGGGAPSDRLWPHADPLALAPGPDGGLWVLDAAGTLYRLDRRLDPADADPGEQEPDFFQGEAGEETRSHALPPVPRGLSLAASSPGFAGLALAALPGGAVALLAARTGKSGGRILLVGPDGAQIGSPVDLDFTPHDFAAGQATHRQTDDRPRLAVSRDEGNQAAIFSIFGEGRGVAIVPTVEVFPMRRYGGRAIVAIGGFLHYDSGDAPAWVRLVERPRRLLQPSSTFLTPIFDGHEPQTVWDRLRIDGCIPPGAGAAIEGCASDSPGGEDGILAGEWLSQPGLVLNPQGSEFAGYGPQAVPATDAAAGRGSWELLFQQLRGRYMQLRIRLASDGEGGPHLRALRAWYPRQGWAERFLPAVYREDPSDTDFLERFLANMEGTLDVIERRIVDAQALFEPRTAPAETLDWLASWFEVALHPAWDERRRRLFIAHAVEFFRLRGTMRGLETALALWFVPATSERLFDGSAARDAGIRIVENFLTRRSTAAPVHQSDGRFWTPAEGNGGLADRLARARGKGEGAPAAARAEPVALFAEDPDHASALEAALGFVPRAAAGERARWRQFQVAIGRGDAADLPREKLGSAAAAGEWRQFTRLASRSRRVWREFLEGRYRRISALNAAHGSAWARFADVALPDRLPATAAGQRDWHLLETQLLPMDAAAHRFSVLLPIRAVGADRAELTREADLARRIVALEKPAHTAFDVRFFFAMNRIGDARVGFDTMLGQGSRAPELLPPAVLGAAYAGESFIGNPLGEEPRYGLL